jgi:hypothetical protein
VSEKHVSDLFERYHLRLWTGTIQCPRYVRDRRNSEEGTETETETETIDDDSMDRIVFQRDVEYLVCC